MMPNVDGVSIFSMGLKENIFYIEHRWIKNTRSSTSMEQTNNNNKSNVISQVGSGEDSVYIDLTLPLRRQRGYFR